MRLSRPGRYRVGWRAFLHVSVREVGAAGESGRRLHAGGDLRMYAKRLHVQEVRRWRLAYDGNEILWCRDHRGHARVQRSLARGCLAKPHGQKSCIDHDKRSSLHLTSLRTQEDLHAFVFSSESTCNRLITSLPLSWTSHFYDIYVSLPRSLPRHFTATFALQYLPL
jgi:hypothetical protein